MSTYGHLTESTIIPRKSKEIHIGNSGLGELEAILKHNKGKIITRTPTPLGYISKKRKVEEPQTTLIPKQQPEDLISQSKLIETKLKIKAKIYDKQERSGVNTQDGLTNFEEKAQQNDTEYEALRREFYSEKHKEIEEKRESQKRYVELGNNQDRERLAWQKKMLEELTDIKKELQGDKVQQSYDKILTLEQREALQEVRREQHLEREKISLRKRKRQNEHKDRITKLIKLGVITEEDVKH